MWPTKEIADPHTGQIRVMAERCPTCIYRPDGLQLVPGGLADITRRTAQREGHIVCHETYMDVPDNVPGAICRGYIDATGNDSLAVRVARVTDSIVEVQPDAIV